MSLADDCSPCVDCGDPVLWGSRCAACAHPNQPSSAATTKRSTPMTDRTKPFPGYAVWDHGKWCIEAVEPGADPPMRVIRHQTRAHAVAATHAHADRVGARYLREAADMAVRRADLSPSRFAAGQLRMHARDLRRRADKLDGGGS